MLRCIDGPQRGPGGSRATSYGRALRTMRAWRDMSGKRLAEVSGYSSAAISHWERGVHNISLQVRKDLCEALRFPLDVMENLAKGESALERAAVNLAEFNEPGELIDRFELARRSGVGPRIIQTYVDKGLIDSIVDGKRRYYTLDTIEIARKLKANRMSRQIASYQKTMRERAGCRTSSQENQAACCTS